MTSMAEAATSGGRVGYSVVSGGPVDFTVVDSLVGSIVDMLVGGIVVSSVVRDTVTSSVL